ncbi:MAG TPA: flagellar export chaperone FliS [Opitutaceae bacterium]|nr:flagellar export chaperone FliS [Opitutaceae bacterium]
MVAHGYAQTYRSNAVLTASPGQLVLMLYDGVLKSLAIARDAFGWSVDDPRRIEAINQQLLKAQKIITELQSGLNHDAGGEVAQTLERLYDYYNRRLFEANLRKQVEPVVEVERLVRDLRNAWAEMLCKQGVPAAESVRSVA